MARTQFQANVRTTFADPTIPPSFTTGPGSVATVTSLATITTDAATVATDVATLVTDGASPTQAHVTTLNTDWGVLNTAIGALGTTQSGDVFVSIDLTKVSTISALRHAFNTILTSASGDSRFTP